MLLMLNLGKISAGIFICISNQTVKLREKLRFVFTKLTDQAAKFST